MMFGLAVDLGILGRAPILGRSFDKAAMCAFIKWFGGLQRGSTDD